MIEMPPTWRLKRLGDLADFVMGQAPPGAQCNKSGIGTPFVKAGEFSDERPIIREWTTRPLKIASKDDVFICVVGATAGKINLGADCAIGRSVAAIRPKGGLDQFFLHKFLSTKVLELRAGSAGSAQGVISKDDLANIEFPLPPPAEQRRIVSKIDSLSGKSKRSRLNLDHIPRLVEKYKQAILLTAFRGELTRKWRASAACAQEWEDTSLGQVLTDIRYGTAKKCRYGGGAVPVLRIPNLQHGRITFSDIKFADFADNELEALRLEEGDILVIRSNGSLDLVGRSAVVEPTAVGMLFAGYLIRLRLDRSLVLPEFVQLYLQSADARKRIERLAKSTSGVNNINSTQIKGFSLSRPNLDEQREIIRRVDKAFAWIDRLVVKATSARTLIDHLAKAIVETSSSNPKTFSKSTNAPTSAV